MNEPIKHQFACDTCLDRGWIIEQGFSPALEHRAECVPCPDCRPEPEPMRRDPWGIVATLFAIFGWLSSWCDMTDRRTRHYLRALMNRRTRLLERRQHKGRFRFLFMPVSDFFRRVILGRL